MLPMSGGHFPLALCIAFFIQWDRRIYYNKAVADFDQTPIESNHGMTISTAFVFLCVARTHRVKVLTQLRRSMHKPLLRLINCVLSMSILVLLSVSVILNHLLALFPSSLSERGNLEHSSRSRNCPADIRSFETDCESVYGTYEKQPKCSMSFDLCGVVSRIFSLLILLLLLWKRYQVTFREDITMKSVCCAFKDSAHSYRPKSLPLSADARVHCSKDPLVALERRTYGVGEFCPDPRTVGARGGAMRTLWAILLLLETGVCAAAIWICRRHQRSSSSWNSHENEVTNAGNNTGAAAVQQHRDL